MVQRSIGAVFFLSISSASGAISREAKSLSIARKSSRSLDDDDEDSSSGWGIDDDGDAFSALAPVESAAARPTRGRSLSGAAARLVWAKSARKSMVFERERERREKESFFFFPIDGV